MNKKPTNLAKKSIIRQDQDEAYIKIRQGKINAEQRVFMDSSNSKEDGNRRCSFVFLI